MNCGPDQSHPAQAEVLVIGAGIQGLCCALECVRRGARVTVLSAGADPRVNPALSLASTTAGESGRLLTVLEGRPFLGVAAGALERPADRGGWLGSSGGAPPEWAPLRRAAAQDAQGLARTTAWYAHTSARALTLWRAIIRSHAELFAGASLHDGRIVRLYNDTRAADAAAQQHAVHGVLDHTLQSPAALLGALPSVRQGIGSGLVRAGLVTNGVSVNIRRCVNNFITVLGRLGVSFVWDSPVTGLQIQAGRLHGAVTDGGVRCAKHVVLVPGAYAPARVLGPLGVRMFGVAGRWLILPRPPDWSGPFKFHRSALGGPDPAAALDLNFMAYDDAESGRPMVAIGGGYLHVGSPPFEFEAAQRDTVDRSIASAVRGLWPGWWGTCAANGGVSPSSALCVRAFTPDDRPAVRVLPTAAGGWAVLHSGLGTGTATMAPAIAQDIADGLERGWVSDRWTLSPERSDADFNASGHSDRTGCVTPPEANGRAASEAIRG